VAEKLLLTWTVKLEVPAAVEVPYIIPVEGLKDSPAASGGIVGDKTG
jgi:hypothetical protein